MEKDVIVIGGRRGEQCRGSISALMQRNVKVADVSEDVNRNAVRSPLPRFFDDVVPEGTKAMLKFGESMENIELRDRS